MRWSERHRSWLISRYDDCVTALADVETFSSDRVRPLLAVMSEAERGAAPVYEIIADWMVVTDPPVHRRLRRVATAALNRAESPRYRTAFTRSSTSFSMISSSGAARS